MRKLSSLVLFPVLLLASTACTVPDALFELPLELESEEYTFDISQIITDWEVGACSNMDSDECKVIIALDKTDGPVSSPPSIPATIPKVVNVSQCVGGAGCVNVDVDILDWADKEGMLDALRGQLAYAAPIDVQAIADSAGISLDGSNGVDVQTIALEWVSNDLNFDTVDIDFYVADGMDAGSSDPAALIADGSATAVGTLAAADAGQTGDVPLVFATGGDVALEQALLTKGFTAVIAVSDAAAVTIPEANGMLVKPAGTATIRVVSVVQFEAGQF